MNFSSLGDKKVHPEIRKDTPLARVLNESGVGKRLQFSANKSSYLRNGARSDQSYC